MLVHVQLPFHLRQWHLDQQSCSSLSFTHRLLSSPQLLPYQPHRYNITVAYCWSLHYFNHYLHVFKCSASPQVEIVGKPQPAAPSQPATPGTEQELHQYRKTFGRGADLFGWATKMHSTPVLICLWLEETTAVKASGFLNVCEALQKDSFGAVQCIQCCSVFSLRRLRDNCQMLILFSSEWIRKIAYRIKFKVRLTFYD